MWSMQTKQINVRKTEVVMNKPKSHRKQQTVMTIGNNNYGGEAQNFFIGDASNEKKMVEKQPKKRANPNHTELVVQDGSYVNNKAPKKKKIRSVSSDDEHHPVGERSRKSSSTYRGVSLCTKDSRWQARIRIRKEVVYLGRFETEEAAARKYDDAAREHHGDKALINFITPEDRACGRKCVFEQAGGKSARV